MARSESTMCFVGGLPVLKPKPHAFTSGATVMSNAPSVLSEMLSARLNTLSNISFVSTSSPRFMCEMIDSLLNIDKASSTFCSSARMSACIDESF